MSAPDEHGVGRWIGFAARLLATVGVGGWLLVLAGTLVDIFADISLLQPDSSWLGFGHHRLPSGAEIWVCGGVARLTAATLALHLSIAFGLGHGLARWRWTRGGVWACLLAGGLAVWPRWQAVHGLLFEPTAEGGFGGSWLELGFFPGLGIACAMGAWSAGWAAADRRLPARLGGALAAAVWLWPAARLAVEWFDTPTLGLALASFACLATTALLASTLAFERSNGQWVAAWAVLVAAVLMVG